MLFMLRANSLLPVVIQAPSTSLQAVRKYLWRLTSESLPYWTVITKLSLEKAQSSTVISFSRIVAKSAGPVPADQMEKLAEYRDAITPLIGAMDINRDEA